MFLVILENQKFAFVDPQLASALGYGEELLKDILGRRTLDVVVEKKYCEDENLVELHKKRVRARARGEEVEDLFLHCMSLKCKDETTKQFCILAKIWRQGQKVLQIVFIKETCGIILNDAFKQKIEKALEEHSWLGMDSIQEFAVDSIRQRLETLLTFGGS